VLGVYRAAVALERSGLPDKPEHRTPEQIQQAMCAESERFKAAGLPFLPTVLATPAQLEQMLTQCEAEAGGPEAFARELGQERTWTWRM
jgi:hypothetical protein